MSNRLPIIGIYGLLMLAIAWPQALPAADCCCDGQAVDSCCSTTAQPSCCTQRNVDSVAHSTTCCDDCEACGIVCQCRQVEAAQLLFISKDTTPDLVAVAEPIAVKLSVFRDADHSSNHFDARSLITNNARQSLLCVWRK